MNAAASAISIAQIVATQCLPGASRDDIGVPDRRKRADDGEDQDQLEQPHPDIEPAIQRRQVVVDGGQDQQPADGEGDDTATPSRGSPGRAGAAGR